MSDGIKCPQCGSRDLTKVHVATLVGVSAPTPGESVQYKCLICGRHFGYTVPKAG